MPRSGGGRSGGGRSAPARAPTRPTAPAPPPRTTGPQQQQRPMTTTAQAQAPPQTQKSPGLFGQMASTAAGVAVGSSIGHAIGGFFGGGSSSQQAPEQSYEQAGTTDAYAQPADNSLYNAQSQSSQSQAAGPCARDVQQFTQCMDQNQGNMDICGWYMQQLKACQQAARQY